MASRIITPPDKLRSPGNFLIINAIDEDVEKLIMHLKTCPIDYDVHLYHSGMENHLIWIKEMSRDVDNILVNEKYYAIIDDSVKDILDLRHQTVIYYGENNQHKELVDYFIALDTV